MRYLIVCHDTGAEMAPLVAWLANDAQNEIMLATDRGRDDFSPQGARKIILRRPEFKLARESLPEYLSGFMRRAEKAVWSLKVVAETREAPDIVLASSSGGLVFSLPELFPTSFIVNYLEDLASWPVLEADARKLMQIMQIARSRAVYAFDEAAKANLPPEFQDVVNLAPLAVDTDFFSPAQTSNQDGPIVFCLRGLQPRHYARVLGDVLKLCQIRKNAEIRILTPNPVTSRLAANMLEKPAAPFADRLKIMRNPTRVERKDLLTGASVAICPQFGLDALEAMSCGLPVLLIVNNGGSACMDLPAKDRAEFINSVLSDAKLLQKTANQGREHALADFDYRKLIPAHAKRILEAHARFVENMGL